MKTYKNTVLRYAVLFLCMVSAFSCQHFEVPEMDIIPDPPSSSLVYYLTFDQESVADSSLYAFPVVGEGILLPGESVERPCREHEINM